MSIGFKDFFPYLAVIQSGLSFLYLIKNKPNLDNYRKDCYGFAVIILFLLSYFAFTTLTVSFVHTLPDETMSGMNLYVDWPFWAGNNIAFTNSFPADSFRQIGMPFKYHYFSSLLIAHISLCTLLDVNLVSFYLSPIFAGVIFILAAYYLATRFIKNKWLIFGFMLGIVYTDGSIVTFAWHTNICPFGFDYGYTFCLLSLGVLAQIIVEGIIKELFVLSCILLAADTGFKGPIAAEVLIAYGCVSILFLTKKQYIYSMICGLAWLLSFATVYMLFIHNSEVTGDSGVHFIGGFDLDTIVTKARWVNDIYSNIIDKHPSWTDNALVKIYAICKYIFYCNKFVALLLTFSIIIFVLYIVKERKMPALLSCLLTSSFISVLLAIYITQSGGSQMYFLMGMFPHAILASCYAISYATSAYKHTNSVFENKYIVCLLITVFIIGLGASVKQYISNSKGMAKSGLITMLQKYNLIDKEVSYSLDYIDYEALLWIKNNTNNDDVIAVRDPTKENYMAIGVFSQRYIWNEFKYVPNLDEAKRRNDIIDSLENTPEIAIETMKKNGVTYFISYKNNSKSPSKAIDKKIEAVFENSHYIIYKLI